MKQVLFVHYHFLPVHNVAVKRLLGYAKALPAFGWRVHVLTRAWHGIDEADPSWGLSWEPDLEAQAPVTIHRAKEPPRRRRTPRPAPPTTATPTLGHKVAAKVERLRRMLVGDYPDAFTGWVRPAVAAGIALARDVRVDALLSYCPPETNHLVARRLARRLHVPWIPFFGDLYGFLDAPLPRRSLEGWIRRAHHRWCLAPAAACAAVSPYMVDYLARTYGKRVELVLTGFDPDEYLPPDPPAAAHRLVLSHVGSVYPDDQQPEIFFAGLDRLLEWQPDVAAHLEVRFVGSKCDDRLRAMIDGRPAAGVCSIVPKVDSRTAIAMVRASDALLALTCTAGRDRHGTMSYPTKVFEAFGARRPVLAIPADRDWVDALLADTRTGTTASTADEVARTLADWILAWRRDGRVPYAARDDDLTPYTRRNQVARLAHLLDAVAAA